MHFILNGLLEIFYQYNMLREKVNRKKLINRAIAL
jgi:hypothetical protein